MGRADFLRLGDWNVACSQCGRKRKASTMVKNWQGMWRCPEHNEPRQPQDFVKGVREHITPPFVQPQVDVYNYVCSINGQSGLPGVGTPGCMLPGSTYYNPLYDTGA